MKNAAGDEDDFVRLCGEARGELVVEIDAGRDGHHHVAQNHVDVGAVAERVERRAAVRKTARTSCSLAIKVRGMVFVIASSSSMSITRARVVLATTALGGAVVASSVVVGKRHTLNVEPLPSTLFRTWISPPRLSTMR